MKTLAIFSMCILLWACQNEVIDPDHVQSANDHTVKKTLGSASRGQTLAARCKDYNHNNCTLYVSCRLQEAGFRTWGIDASEYSAKASLINTPSNYLPKYGDVAMFDTGSTWGHMSFVEWRNPWTGEIWVSETNWGGAHYQWRSLERGDRKGSGEPAQFLTGYYQPTKQ